MATQVTQQTLVQCPGVGVDSGAVIRAAAISGTCSAIFVVAIFVLISWIRRRRAPQTTVTATAPPPPPESPAPPHCIYCYNAPAEYYAPPPLYAPPPMYAPPPPSWPHVTVVNNNTDGGASDIEALGYAATAGTTAASACIVM